MPVWRSVALLKNATVDPSPLMTGLNDAALPLVVGDDPLRLTSVLVCVVVLYR